MKRARHSSRSNSPARSRRGSARGRRRSGRAPRAGAGGRRPRRSRAGCRAAPRGRLRRGATGMIGSRAPQTISSGSVLGQVEAVEGGDALALGADHRAQGREEGLAARRRRRARRSRGRPRRRRRWAAGRPSPRPRPSTEPTWLPTPAVGGDEEIGAGQRRGAQDRAHLGPEAAAGDQHQALDHLRELVGELHRDAAAERVADQGRALVAEGEQQVAQAGGEAAERVVAAAGSESPWPGQVGGDHGVVAGQRLDHRRASSRRCRPSRGSAAAPGPRRRRGSRPRGRGAAAVFDRSPARRRLPATVDGTSSQFGVLPAHRLPIPILSRPWPTRRRPRPPRGALIVVAVGLLASSPRPCSPPTRPSGEAAQLEWVQKKHRCPTPSRSRVPGGGGKMQLTEAEHPRDRDQRQRLLALPRLGDAADRRRRAGRQRPHPLLDARSRAAPKSPRRRRLRASYPRSSERPDRTGRAGNRRWSNSARTAPNWPSSKSKTSPTPSPPSRAIKLEWPDLQGRASSTGDWFLPPGQARRKDLVLPFDDDLENDRDPRGRDRLHADHQRRQGDRRDRRRTGEASPNRSTNKPNESGRRSRRKGRRRLASAGSGRPAARALRHPFADLVQLRVGGGAVHPAPRRAARTSRPRPRRSRSGRSQAASASAPGRIAGIRSWTLATTSFGRRGDDRAAVEPAVVEAAVLLVLPLLAGADAGEGEGLAAVDGEAPGLARLLGVLGLHPLVEAVGDDQAAVAELADQRARRRGSRSGSRLWR